MVVGIRAHNNNTANTVLQLFLHSVSVHGIPSRVRGDHGTENIEVAKWMEANRGLERGSYIWGRSVHNTRIERIWYDVTQGFGKKWKDFFIDLEAHHGLDVSTSAHVWLIHHLFLPAINDDAISWAESWNSHKLHVHGEPLQTPREMFFFSMLQDGPRGLDNSTHLADDEDPAAFGIDWEAIHDRRLMQHHLSHNPEEVHENPFDTAPKHLSEVVCKAPKCPLTPGQLYTLEHELAMHVDLNTQNMTIRRQIWVVALQICMTICTTGV